jgi:methenyltetrahydromethanopterin cyclohydrolase
MSTLNRRALRVADALIADAGGLRIAVGAVAGATVLDCGVKAPGGLRAGLGLARACLSDLGDVVLIPGDDTSLSLPRVQVVTDQPVLACMASQYAGWQVAAGGYFAMGSGPMRAAYGKEKLFDDIPGRESATLAVGVLEGKLPTDEAIAFLSEKLKLPPAKITLLVARTKSLAGTLQVVARCLEMALHKLHELKFDLAQVVSGTGVVPLPPPAADDLAAIGRTNDAILYAGRATVWVDADDAQIAEIGPKVPSSASPEYGALFGELFAKYKDFYKIDPMLFSPAEIAFCNVRTGRVQRFGKVDADVLRRSFGG